MVFVACGRGVELLNKMQNLDFTNQLLHNQCFAMVGKRCILNKHNTFKFLA